MWCFSTTRAVASPFPKTNEATRRSEIQRFRVNQVRESPAGQQQRPVGEAGDVVADDDLAERGDVDAAEPAPGFPLVSGCPDLPRLLAPREQCPVLVELHAPACEAVPFRVPLQVLPGFAAVRRPGDDGALEGVDGAAGRLDQGQPLVVRTGVPGHAHLAHRDFPQLAAAHVQDAVAGLHASQLVGGHGAAAQGSRSISCQRSSSSLRLSERSPDRRRYTYTPLANRDPPGPRPSQRISYLPEECGPRARVATFCPPRA